VLRSHLPEEQTDGETSPGTGSFLR